MLRYSATAVAYVTAYGTPGRVDMGNVGLNRFPLAWAVKPLSTHSSKDYELTAQHMQWIGNPSTLVDKRDGLALIMITI